jgi:hypothetical protein
MDVLVEGSHESESSACSALSVRRSSKTTATFDPGNAGIGCYLVFHGAIPWCESSAKLFR